MERSVRCAPAIMCCINNFAVGVLSLLLLKSLRQSIRTMPESANRKVHWSCALPCRLWCLVGQHLAARGYDCVNVVVVYMPGVSITVFSGALPHAPRAFLSTAASPKKRVDHDLPQARSTHTFPQGRKVP